MIQKPANPWTGEIETMKEFTNLRQMLAISVNDFPNRTAFCLKRDKKYVNVTYTEYQNDVNALGTAFVALGLKDEKIAVIGENRYEWCLAYSATVNGCGVVVPLDKELPEAEIANLLNRSESSAIVYSSKLADKVEKVAPFVPSLKHLICMDGDYTEDNKTTISAMLKKGYTLVEDGNRTFIDATIDDDAMSVLIFTSGTTDIAKGVMLSHRNICSNVLAVKQSLYMNETDSILSILPLHHTYECTTVFHVFISSGAKISFCEGIRYIAKNIAEYKPSVIMLVPLIVENMYKKIWDKVKKSKMDELKLKLALNTSFISRKLFKADMRKKLFSAIHEPMGGNLRLIIAGAAALSPEVWKGFEDFGITIKQGYGLTEASPIVCVNPEDSTSYSSVGTPLAGIEVKIVDADKDGVGEIICKGDNVMLGYYKNEEATNECLKDGWLYTGDLGYLDKKGYLYITGRKKNVIVTKNGKNIFPEEVEAYLNKSPFIKESLVYGDDSKSETAVHAQIILDMDKIQEKFPGEELSEEKINELVRAEIKHVNSMMPTYKYIKRYYIREKDFEKTTTQKIKRYGQTIEGRDYKV